MSGMRMEFSPRQEMGLRQIIAPRMIQSMEILQMPLLALLEKLDAELQENPFLEIKEKHADEETPEPEFDPDAVLKHDDTGDLEFNRLEEINRDWEDHFNEEHRPSRASLVEQSDKKLEAMMNIASAAQSLQEHLSEGLAELDLSPDEMAVCEYVISHLDNNGYFLGHDAESGRPQPLSFEELARSCPTPVGPGDIEKALHQVQQLDPAGVGARDTKECLLLQVDDDTPHHDLVRALVLHHLEDVAANRLPVIQKRTGADLAAVKEAIDQLRHLDPKPGARFTTESVQYVTPDVRVTRTDDGDFDIRLTDDWVPNVRISKRYVEVAKDKTQDPKTRDWMQNKFRSAHWLIDAIEQRRNTLIKVTRAIINHQRAFLDKGPEFIQPLKMDEIAKLVGVHVTTVSRAVDDKWAETPRGVFPLKRFFGGGTVNKDTGEGVAWERIKQQLLEIIAAEDKAHPLSDEDIVERFKTVGLDVARRTVTKYREALSVPSSRQRRDWTPRA